MTRPKRSATIRPTRGSDFRKTVPLIDETGEPFNLFGLTVDVFEVSPELEDLLSVAVLDAIGGLIEIQILWNNALLGKDDYSFRLWIKPGEKNDTSTLIGVSYQ